jgi:hypothetical protein
VSVADLNTIDAANGTGIITATVATGTATTLKALTGTTNAYTMTLSAGSESAADLIALDAITTVAVGASALTGMTGTAANIKTVIAATTITKPTNYAVTPSDATVSVADLNIMDAATTGIITETVVTGTAAALKLLTGTGNAYTTTLTAGSAAAADLIAIDTATTIAVGAGAITAITGLVADIKTVISSTGITKPTNYAVTPSDATVSVADLNIIDAANGTGVITETVITGTAATLAGLTGTGNAYTTTLSAGIAAATDLIAIDAATTVTVGAGAVKGITGAAANVVTVMAATTITKTLTGLALTATSATAAQANTIFGYTNTGVSIVELVNSYTTGSAVAGMKITDVLDIDTSNTTTALSTTAATSAASVTAAGKWFFNTTSKLFTWWDDSEVTPAAQSITLTGVKTVSVLDDLVTMTS